MLYECVKAIIGPSSRPSSRGERDSTSEMNMFDQCGPLQSSLVKVSLKCVKKLVEKLAYTIGHHRTMGGGCCNVSGKLDLMYSASTH